MFPYEEKAVIGIGPEKVVRIYRPIIPIRIYGPDGEYDVDATADTGADDTLLPDSLLGPLGIDARPQSHAVIIVLNGNPMLVRYARVDLELSTSGVVYRWSARVGFHAGHRAVLGHQGFFDHFTASFNGRRRLLTLTPNGTAPGPAFGVA